MNYIGKHRVYGQLCVGKYKYSREKYRAIGFLPMNVHKLKFARKCVYLGKYRDDAQLNVGNHRGFGQL